MMNTFSTLSYIFSRVLKYIIRNCRIILRLKETFSKLSKELSRLNSWIYLEFESWIEGYDHVVHDFYVFGCSSELLELKGVKIHFVSAQMGQSTEKEWRQATLARSRNRASAPIIRGCIWVLKVHLTSPWGVFGVIRASLIPSQVRWISPLIFWSKISFNRFLFSSCP